MAKIIGILNITPDSFSDGGKFNSTEEALAQARQLFNDGADLVDVGAVSTKPGSKTVQPEDEWARMESFWEGVKHAGNLVMENFSLDTRHPQTARKFLELGGKIINDVTGFQNQSMIELAVEFKAVCIVNHFPGATVEEVHEQNISSIERVKEDLLARAESLVQQGIKREKIILDPGIGFGKTPDLNAQLLTFASEVPTFPVLIGHSKKRFLGNDRFEKTVNVQAAKMAVEAGAAYLRVHDPAWYK